MRSVSATACWVIVVDWLTWRAISLIEAESSSPAAATVCTLDDATREAAATVAAWRFACSAVRAMASAVARISEAAEATMPEIFCTRSATWRCEVMSVAYFTTRKTRPLPSSTGL